MPYRDTHPVKIDPRFSYVEKCFISSSRGKRFIGHALLFGGDLGRLLMLSLVVLFVGALTLGAGYLFVNICSKISHLLHIEIEGAFIIFICTALIIYCIFKIASKQIKSNSKMIQSQIDEKIRLSEMKLEDLPSDIDSKLFYNRCMSEMESLKEEINERVSER